MTDRKGTDRNGTDRKGTEQKGELWRRAAGRAADRPFFLAAALRAYQELHRMDDEGLAAELGCAPADLPRLGLCRRPDPAPGRLRADVERIAARFGMPTTPLARLVRDVEAARKLGSAPESLRPADAGELLAARDREADRDEDPPTGESPARG